MITPQFIEARKKTQFKKGHKVPKEWRKITSNTHKGKTLSEEHKEKMIKKGEEHYCWKGNEATKTPLHKWVRKHKDKSKVCEFCKKERKLDLASMTNHNYTRNPNDYKWLCHSCHMKMDKSVKV